MLSSPTRDLGDETETETGRRARVCRARRGHRDGAERHAGPREGRRRRGDATGDDRAPGRKRDEEWGETWGDDDRDGVRFLEPVLGMGRF